MVLLLLLLLLLLLRSPLLHYATVGTSPPLQAEEWLERRKKCGGLVFACFAAS